MNRQKLKDEIGKSYCEKHGLEFTKVNQSEEMKNYVDQRINELFQAHQKDIVYCGVSSNSN